MHRDDLLPGDRETYVMANLEDARLMPRGDCVILRPLVDALDRETDRIREGLPVRPMGDDGADIFDHAAMIMEDLSIVKGGSNFDGGKGSKATLSAHED